jgi:hypothetical protein
VLADAAAADKYLGLQQKIGVTGFALDVIDDVLMFDVCVKSKNHFLWQAAIPLREIAKPLRSACGARFPRSSPDEI